MKGHPLVEVANVLHRVRFAIVHASTFSGFFAAACSLPFDYVKTQIQKMQHDAEGKLPYYGSLDCALKTLKSGGPLKFYTGFPIYCVSCPLMSWYSLSLCFSPCVCVHVHVHV